MRELISRAEQFARNAHADHFLKNSKREPYVLHLEGVASLVTKAAGTEEEVAAAWLHDSVEDMGVTLEEIRQEFGDGVAKLVSDLTDSSEYRDLPVSERKARQLERISQKSDSVKKIKLADQIWNTLFVQFDPPLDMSQEEIREYTTGCRKVIEACKDVSPMLYSLYQEKLHQKVRL